MGYTETTIFHYEGASYVDLRRCVVVEDGRSTVTYDLSISLNTNHPIVFNSILLTLHGTAQMIDAVTFAMTAYYKAELITKDEHDEVIKGIKKALLF